MQAEGICVFTPEFRSVFTPLWGAFLVSPLETENNFLGIWEHPRNHLSSGTPRVLVAAHPVVSVLLESPMIGECPFDELWQES